MPRLSIIVPHLHDDSGLEQTILSILENQSRDIELLIVHDGRYTDPYGLDQDEAALIETAHGTGLTAQVNLGVAAACSPYIQVIMPGTTVDAGWFVESLSLIERSEVDVVAQPISCTDREEVVGGLNIRSLPHRRIADSNTRDVSPLLLGSVFRKKFLTAISGWFDNVSREVAEVEMGLLIESLGIQVAIASEATLHANHRVACGSEAGYEIGHACGQLANAYASVEDSGIIIDSLVRRLGHLASGLMSPKTVAERLGWVMGLRNRAYVQPIQERLQNAVEAIDAIYRNTIPMNQSSDRQQRRAA